MSAIDSLLHLLPHIPQKEHANFCVQLERAGKLEAGTGGEGMTADDPLLLMRVMEVREQIEDAKVRAIMHQIRASVRV